MFKRSIFTLILLLCVFVGTSFAFEVTLLGPNEYIRTKGKPNQFSNTFPGDPDQGKLIIQNGDENGKHRISSATIKLNGEVVVKPNSFSQKVDQIEISVNLLEENTLEVSLASKPGSFISIKAVQNVEAEAAGVIGPDGGVVEVTDPESELYGVKIEIPKDALGSPALIQIDRSLTSMTFSEKEDFIIVSPTLLIEPENIQLQKNCRIISPYQDSDNDGYLDGTIFKENYIKVYYSKENSEGVSNSTRDYIIDTENNYVIISTNHFSDWEIIARRWKYGVIVNYFIESVPHNGTDENNFYSDVHKAFDLWQNAIDDYVYYLHTENEDNADIKIKAVDFCNTEDEDFECGGIGQNRRNRFSGKSTTYFNINVDDESVPWKANEYCDDPETRIPFLRMALHEFGHTFGLNGIGNIKDEEDIMNRCSIGPSPICDQGCDLNNRVIMRYDIRGYGYPFIALSCLDVSNIRSHYELSNPPNDDTDGLPNLCDNCPYDSNPDQADSDGDGTGDACENEDPSNPLIDDFEDNDLSEYFFVEEGTYCIGLNSTAYHEWPIAENGEIHGTGSGYNPEHRCPIRRPIDMNTNGYFELEATLKAGTGWPNFIQFNLLDGNDGYIFHFKGEDNHSGAEQLRIYKINNCSNEPLLDKGVFSIAPYIHNDNTYKIVHQIDGSWQIYINEVLQNVVVLSDTEYFSFDNLTINTHRNDSHLDYYKISWTE